VISKAARPPSTATVTDFCRNLTDFETCEVFLKIREPAQPRVTSNVAMSTHTQTIVQRRHDLDWLRVIAFGLLIYFHTAIAFIPGGIPLIQNDSTSPVLSGAVAFLQEFRLPLLFLVSGAGVCFALRHRSNRAFVIERCNRLLRPLAFGILFLVPPMVYYEKQFIGTFDGSLMGFYGALLSDGVYPSGNLSWHHFWFLVYLFLFCLIALPVFRYLQATGAHRVTRLQRFLRSGVNLYLPIVPLVVVEVSLRWLFPGFRDLVHDWASFSIWLLVFVGGFTLAASEPLLNHTKKLRHISLGMAVLASAVLLALYWQPARAHFTPVQDGQVGIWNYLLFCVVRMVNLWAWLMAIVGFGGVYLNRPSRVLSYLNDAVFPLFCFHLPIIVVLGCYIVPLPWDLWTKFAAITTLTTLLSLLLYHLIVRPGTALSPWLGGRQVARRVHASTAGAGELPRPGPG
jgi:peptidoglycan/LPS O-acetylase OafA/YrhL